MIKVFDVESGDFPVPAHCVALVDIYGLKNKGSTHPVHEMIEVHRPEVPTTQNPRALKGRRFYTLDTILRSAHVVPAGQYTLPKQTNTFFINNYIDWDQYQVLYKDNPDWLENSKTRAEAAREELFQGE